MDQYAKRVNAILTSVAAVQFIKELDQEQIREDIAVAINWEDAKKMVSFWVDILNRVEPK